ncbi:helicase/secretion neighborhood TadE-like protein [Ruaniaceae bacterium KH17]|nr:helicase/secretion neighborhood TadE-like protein [Ruaniaceae bacterium KH17]
MRKRMQRLSANREEGAATVLMLAIVAVVLVLIGFTALLGTASAARHSAQSAADLAALAAAEVHLSHGSACAIAAQVSELNDAELVGCEIQGEFVVVRVRVPVAGMWASATARAGPG